ncbi:MAG: gluconolaconase [Chloracidobacterium sp.]|nr:gluconolaconase [Chloracidobacterium sp.]
MNQSGTIKSVEPKYAIPGAEIAIEIDGFSANMRGGNGVFVGGEKCRIVAASSSRVLAVVPDIVGSIHTQIHLEVEGRQSEPFPIVIGKKLAGGMHIVANPAVDALDDALILTRSGSRGQQLDETLFRLEPDGFLDDMPYEILNPTGIAFDREGRMFVTNRARGEVYLMDRDGTSSVYATGLGVATGIAFDKNGEMYVGDRSGTIHRVKELGIVETFAVIEPSVAAYHLAFGPDEQLYVSAPGLASFDAVHVIDHEGFDERFFRGLGRPQGLAFDKAGNLYVAGCYRGHHGITRILPDGSAGEHFVAGNNVVGLCFTRKGEMIVATNDSVYSIPCGIEGVLLG